MKHAALISGALVATLIAPTPDPRPTLRAGWFDAGEAAWNVRLVSSTKPSPSFMNPSKPGDPRLWNSDLAFTGKYVFQGNWGGYQVWDISNPAHPTLRTAYVCPGSQSDVSVYKNLLFVSSEATNARLDCGMQGVPDTVSKERARGLRVFDITDIGHPKYLTTVQTCRGSHTHTVVPDLKDNSNIYIYISGRSIVRSPNEMPGCSALMPDQDPNSSLFRIEVIQVPLAHPDQAKIVSSPRIFENLGQAPKHPELLEDSLAALARHDKEVADSLAAGRPAPISNPQPPGAPTQCHDITVYPALGLAGGACAGYGFLLDISDVAHPVRIAAASDKNFSFWHSATFNNDGTKILFSDEWGGGTQPRCRATDKKEWGADAIFDLANRNKLTFESYYKLPVAQTSNENCVAHNGTLVPIPGRDILVQAWYQGGLSMFDWTDAAHPKEIAYFDRGPIDSTKFVMGGYWSTYWYNGYIVASEIARGLDIFELVPSEFISRNEIAAAKLVHFDYLNAQDQPKLTWPANIVVARAYLDQIVRDNGLPRARTSKIARDLDRIERMSGSRRAALATLATQVDQLKSTARDQARVGKIVEVLRQLAAI